MTSSESSIGNDSKLEVPLVRTKLCPPSLPGGFVDRKRLETLLEQALHVPLAVVSAPAGYGKTVLASTWARTLDSRSAWLSLDSGESELRQFVRYLCEAIEDTTPNGMPATRDLLDSAESAPVDVVAANVMNDINSIAGPLTIILDDFHHLRTDSTVIDMISSILQHPPPRLHLVILTRRDPPLEMNRLRAGNLLIEVRLRDLRFDADETREFICGATPSLLSEAAIEHLDKELEGWPVGLRLVALMLKRAQDPEEAIAGLRGGIPESREYMLREVLAGLPDQTRRCLLQSSVLNRFTIESVDAVCRGAGTTATGIDGRILLNEIRRENLFAYSLDEQRRWYRYHHWFQHVLERQLRIEFDDCAVRNLHLRAGNWLDANDEPEEALLHFIAADQPDRAVELVARRYLAEIEKDRWYAVERWVQQLPEEIRLGSIEMQLAQAWVGFYKLDFSEVACCIERISALDNGAAKLETWMPQLHFLRGWLTYWSGDTHLALMQLDQAIDSFPKNPGMLAGELRLYYAFALCMKGDCPGAVRFLAEQRVAAGPNAGRTFLNRIHAAHSHVAYIAGDIVSSEAATGRIRTVDEPGSSRYEQAWCNYFRALQSYSRFELVRTLEYFALCEKHLNVLERRVAADVLGASAQAELLRGNCDRVAEAQLKLERFVRNYRLSEGEWLIESIVASRNLWTGDKRRALQWARSVLLPGISALETHMWAINPEVTQARVLVTAGDDQDAERGLSILDELSKRYRAYHNQCQLFDVDVLRAVALMRLGNNGSARSTLTMVVDEAAPGGWIRPFVEAGESMKSMLSQIDPGDTDEGFLKRLQETLGQRRTIDDEGRQTTGSRNASGRDVGTAVANGLSVDDLTDREMDILECLEQRLQNKEIAARLYISPHTVGYHLKHIYQKLGVHGRRQAVRKARASGLLSPS